jgi:predicted dehydrogenase
VSKLRLVVIGAGHLGRIHARLAQTIDGVRVVGVCDPIDAARAAVAEQLACPTFADLGQIPGEFDAAIVASPTVTHATVVAELLSRGKHVLCEKPLTIDHQAAHQLAETARRRQLVLQVGHIERFNPAWQAGQNTLAGARYIEAVRASSFPGRCLDVGVVLDLMIHDIDLVLSLAGELPARIDATGMAVISNHEDLAEARLTFASGLVACLKASRISPAPRRRWQAYGPAGYTELDFSAPAALTIEPHASIRDGSFDLSEHGSPTAFQKQLFEQFLVSDPKPLEPRNAILDELHDFVISIRSGSSPIVDGQAGAAAVDCAQQILAAIHAHPWNRQGTLRGPHARPASAAQRPAIRPAA